MRQKSGDIVCLSASENSSVEVQIEFIFNIFMCGLLFALGVNDLVDTWPSLRSPMFFNSQCFSLFEDNPRVRQNYEASEHEKRLFKISKNTGTF